MKLSGEPEEARTEIERLRQMLDLRGTGPAERYWEGRWRDEAAENERLTKERDEARAKVKVALQLAVNAVWDIQPQTCTANVAGTIGRAIRALTPAHAKAALEAHGREKVREGMQRAAVMIQGNTTEGIALRRAILAEMEKLK